MMVSQISNVILDVCDLTQRHYAIQLAYNYKNSAPPLSPARLNNCYAVEARSGAKIIAYRRLAFFREAAFIFGQQETL